jgi:hypothetical protein
MGSTGEQCQKAGLDECYSDEQHFHSVELDGYWIQRGEVTNEQYKRCVEAEACEPPDNVHWDKLRSVLLPVTNVDWNQAAAYAARVGGRLPTEAEWEKACRGEDGRIYPWGDEPPATERLNYSREFGGATEAGTYPPGANGLYDMSPAMCGSGRQTGTTTIITQSHLSAILLGPIWKTDGGRCAAVCGCRMSSVYAAPTGTSIILTTGSTLMWGSGLCPPAVENLNSGKEMLLSIGYLTTGTRACPTTRTWACGLDGWRKRKSSLAA